MTNPTPNTDNQGIGDFVEAINIVNKERVMNAITRNEDKTITINFSKLPEELKRYEHIVVKYYKGDKVVEDETLEVFEFIDSIAAIVNGTWEKDLSLDPEFTAIVIMERTNSGAVQLVNFEKNWRGKWKKPAIQGMKPTDNKSLVSLMEAITKVRKGRNKKEDSVSTTETNDKKPNIIVRAYRKTVSGIKKVIAKLVGWAKSFWGWNIEQREAIIASVATMFGGMWFWFIMGGSLPIYVFGTTTALWTLTALGFVASYALVAYGIYGVIWCIVAAISGTVNWMNDLLDFSDVTVTN